MLVIDAFDLTGSADGGRVVQIAVEVGETHNGSDALDLPGDLLKGLLVGVHEGRLEEEVLGWVAGYGELGEGHEICAGVAGALRPLEDLRGVALEITDRRVHLRERQAERPHTLML